MDKFGRNYELTIGTAIGLDITVTLPFTVEFDITRNALSSANACQLRIYNLSKFKRNQIRFNIYEYATFRQVEFRAGYGDNLATIFKGNITEAWSYREGVNFITQIECYDGGFALSNGRVDLPIPQGVRRKDAIRAVAETLPHTNVGAVGNYSDTLGRGNSYSGNTATVLNQLSGNGFFIDVGNANVLQTNEFIPSVTGPVFIDARSGLLGTPVLERTILRFDMLFEPSLNIGYLASILSLTEENFSGLYKITAVKHRGVISDAICGSAITTGEFFFDKVLTPVTP